MNRLTLYIKNLMFQKEIKEFEIQEIVNSDLLYNEFESKLDNILNEIYNIDMKINLLTEYLINEEPKNDNI